MTVRYPIHISVFALPRCVLQNLDRTTLKLLKENPRLELFAPALLQNLQDFHDRASASSPQLPPKSR
jgi:hypothetical protein